MVKRPIYHQVSLTSVKEGGGKSEGGGNFLLVESLCTSNWIKVSNLGLRLLLVIHVIFGTIPGPGITEIIRHFVMQ